MYFLNNLQYQPILAHLTGPEFDHLIAAWFRQRLTSTIVMVLDGLSGPGSAVWIGTVTALAMLLLAAKRRWYPLLALTLTVPGGALLGETIKLMVQRPRPYLTGPFGDWGGYSFPSGHTISATLLYGFMAAWLPLALTHSRWRFVQPVLAIPVILGVGFSRIALGAHYVTDVLGAMVLGTAWLTLCWHIVAALRHKNSRASILLKSIVVSSEDD